MLDRQSAATASFRMVLSTTIDGQSARYDVKGRQRSSGFSIPHCTKVVKAINGIKDQSGGSLDVAGPIWHGGMMYSLSGYAARAASAEQCVVGIFNRRKMIF